ncbi:TPA: hypothetical protein I7727_22155, partial [Vibrio vulnificus]|nr:hypothetical protein [Vibrio vulnificus]
DNYRKEYHMENEVEPSFKISTRIWWNITWKTMVFGVPFSLVGGMFGMILTGGNEQLADTFGSICSWIAVIPIAILVIKTSLNTTYGKYRVSLTELAEENSYLEGQAAKKI